MRGGGIIEVVKDMLAGAALLAMAAAFVWLCCAASGYHWE